MAKRRDNQEGTFYQRKNGTWRVQVTINGQRLSHTGKTKGECKLWIRDILNTIEDGLTLNRAQLKFEKFLSNWLVSCKASLRSKTMTQYHQIVRDYIIPDLGKIKLIELRPHHIQALYDAKVAEGVGLRTVQLTHSIIHTSLNHAVKLGLIGRNPDNATKPPKPSIKEIKVLDETEVQRLIITAKANDDRYQALYQLAITTGMRQSELLGLKWGDLDFDRKTINVQRQLIRVPGVGFDFGPPKTKSGIRTVAIGSAIANTLQDHRERQYFEMQCASDRWQGSDLMFTTRVGTPVHWRNFYRSYKKLLVDAGLPDIRFHDLRHTAASLMLNHGVPLLIVSKRLGHARPSITLDIYGHLLPSMQEHAAAVMDEIITPIQMEELHQTTPKLPQER